MEVTIFLALGAAITGLVIIILGNGILGALWIIASILLVILDEIEKWRRGVGERK